MPKKVFASLNVSINVRDAVKWLANEYGTSSSGIADEILWKAYLQRRRVLARKSRRETSTSKIGS